MWICPKCGRGFKKLNQGHYCGEAPKTVSEYIESQSIEAQSHLRDITTIIRDSVPDVKEHISWSMPVYEKAGKSVSFSACKNHISLYVGIEAIEKFSSALNGYTTKKNAIYLPYSKMLPLKLIEDIVKWCLAQPGTFLFAGSGSEGKTLQERKGTFPYVPAGSLEKAMAEFYSSSLEATETGFLVK